MKILDITSKKNADWRTMNGLNYHHLRYFWLVAKEGGLARAAAKSRVAHQTVGSQVRLLEQALGETLFAKQGRRLVLTDTGRVVQGYAEEIFGIGRDLQDRLRGRPAARRAFRVGVTDGMPRLVAEQILRPARRLVPAVRMVCRTGRPENLLAQLALQALDVVLADAPVGGEVGVRAYNHLLGESPVGLFAGARLAHTLRAGWPRSLAGAPVALPASHTTLRRALDAWFEREDILPHVVAEIDDSALLLAFASDGRVLFPAPDAVAGALRAQHRLVRAGPAGGLKERYYGITVQRRSTDPAVAAMTRAAAATLSAAARAGSPPARRRRKSSTRG